LNGTHGAAIKISEEDKPQAKVKIISPCRELWIPGLIPCRGEGIAHIILEVTDEGSPRLTSYRRIILRVRALPEK